MKREEETAQAQERYRNLSDTVLSMMISQGPTSVKEGQYDLLIQEARSRGLRIRTAGAEGPVVVKARKAPPRLTAHRPRWNLLSAEGRLNRARFVVLSALTYAVTAALSLPAGVPDLYLVLRLPLGIVLTVFYVFQILKRLHDLERPSEHFWYLLIPFYNIGFMVYLHLARGTMGANRYGQDPLATE